MINIRFCLKVNNKHHNYHVYYKRFKFLPHIFVQTFHECNINKLFVYFIQRVPQNYFQTSIRIIITFNWGYTRLFIATLSIPVITFAKEFIFIHLINNKQFWFLKRKIHYTSLLQGNIILFQDIQKYNSNSNFINNWRFRF